MWTDEDDNAAAQSCGDAMMAAARRQHESRLKYLRRLTRWPAYTETSNRMRQQLANELRELETKTAAPQSGTGYTFDLDRMDDDGFGSAIDSTPAERWHALLATYPDE